MTIREIAERARSSSRQMAQLSSATKQTLLQSMGDALLQAKDQILQANQQDLQAAEAHGASPALLDRLRLTPERLANMASALAALARFPDPVGELLDQQTTELGLRIERRRVPLGVVAIVFEARPNVCSDAAGLCLLAGNAVILRGGSDALNSNRSITAALRQALEQQNLPVDAVQLVDSADRRKVEELLQLEGYIDVVIPRGGESLIRTVVEQSRIPVIKHYKGVCHIYVDESADPEMAERILINAKCQRPGVCNAVETLLIHQKASMSLLPQLCRALEDRGVAVRGDERARGLVASITPAAEADWRAEYLDLLLAIRVVDSLDEAITHIETYGSHHSDAIVTSNSEAAERFLREVDSAAVYVNASTRFTDGEQFGLGAEIGISTDKLHARGPMGVRELTSYKWIVRGNGTIRP
ncbi:MAG: glutamate-5-semialdehyde dehydrogenase [Bdellovibrionales bacterium]|nr:glutamate-5-semialdehyde dehydrogenase [Bdellovibrionales bacterium]